MTYSDEILLELAGSHPRSRIEMWQRFIELTDAQRVAEIGVFGGSFAAAILRRCERISRYYMIDPWRNLPDWRKPMNKPDQVFAHVFDEAMEQTKPWEDKRVVLRGKTTEVIDQLEDESLDFVYVDGDHTLRGIAVDLIKCFPKVRVGGCIAGDDFSASIWQHPRHYEPTLVFPFAVHFAEAVDQRIFGLPHSQFLIEKQPEGSFGFVDLTGTYGDVGLREQLTVPDSGITAQTRGFHVVRPEPRVERPGGDAAPAIVHRGAGKRGEVALTFDDGPSRWTADVAATFEQYNCRATFFLRGGAIAGRPETVAALHAAGHELGNHLWSHTNAATQSQAELHEEIERTADAIEAAGAPRPELIRPPYFSAPEAVADSAAGLGVSAVVLRSIGTSDWEAESAEEIFAPVLANVQAGDIICLHDGISSDKRDSDSRQPTVEAVRQLVPALLERGLRPVTVSQLL